MLALVGLLLAVACPSIAQRVRPGDVRPELPSFEPPEREPGLVLPPLVLPEEPDLPGSSAGARLLVKEVRVSGNTVLPESEIAELTAPFTNRTVAFADLQALRDRLTRAYIERGYITSGAVVEGVDDGVVSIQIVEGVLGEIEISTDGRLRASTLERRLQRKATGPVNVFEFEEQLQILQQDPRIGRVDAQLLPSKKRGESLLRVEVAEARPYFWTLQASNYEPPSIGAEGGRTELGHLNLTGYGDSLRVSYALTEGLNEIATSYEVPLNTYDTSLSLFYRHTDSEVVEDPFDDLDIESRTSTYGVSVRHPVQRSLRSRLDVFLAGEYRRSKTYLLGTGFAFTQGPDPDGVAEIAVLRFGQEWTYRTRRQALAVRSMLSWGLDALGATSNSGNVPDGQFLAWLGQSQWAYRLGLLDAQLLVRGDVQLSSDPLLSLEQFAIGGHASVRGYRENTLVRDNGAVGSIELRIPVWSQSDGRFAVELAPFVDVGYSWNSDRPETGPQTLSSAGLGIRAALTERIFFEGYWGEALRDVDFPGEHDLQDSGFHLGLTMRFF
jgi:hemolysin activation/secretion protein